MASSAPCLALQAMAKKHAQAMADPNAEAPNRSAPDDHHQVDLSFPLVEWENQVGNLKEVGKLLVKFDFADLSKSTYI